MAKPLVLAADGTLQETQPITSSTGSGDATKLAQLDVNGKWDMSLMPTGIGADTQSMVTSDTLVAGDFVNIYNNLGTRNCRKAIATDNTKPAHGFVLSGYNASDTAIVYVRGLNSLVPVGSYVAANVGSNAFLSPSTSGASTATRPTATNQIVQVLGTIDTVGATVTINFSVHPWTLLV
jgi:hypothetical protein